MAADPDTAVADGKRNIRKARWRRFKWAVRLSVLALILGYVVLVGFDGKFYYPNHKLYDRPDDFRLKYEDVHFTTGDGLTLAGWFLPAVGSPARGTVVHFHGNAANISAHVSLVSWLPYEGYNVLMFDYRGYGDSEGSVTRSGTIADGHAAIDYALSRPDVRSLPLFVYGQSLGAAVAIVVAADRPEVAAVVAESPFSGYRRVAALHAQRLLHFEWLAKGAAAVTISSGYDPIDVVDRISPRPLLVIAAEEDDICFPEMARELFDAAKQPKDFWLAEQCGHLEVLMVHDRGLCDRVISLFDSASPH